MPLENMPPPVGDPGSIWASASAVLWALLGGLAKEAHLMQGGTPFSLRRMILLLPISAFAGIAGHGVTAWFGLDGPVAAALIAWCGLLGPTAAFQIWDVVLGYLRRKAGEKK